MRLDLATESDNEELCKFYESFILPGHVILQPHRNGDFFAPYRNIGDTTKTFVLRGESDNKIEAMASFIIRDVAYDGIPIKIAIARDLRVSNNRRAILEWSQHFLPVLKQVREEFGAENVFSSLNMDDPTALNTFIRPRNMRRPIPRYYLYRKFNLVSLHGKYPWAPAPIPGLRIREGSSANMSALLDYMGRRSLFRPFSTAWDLDSFNKKMKRLGGMKLSDFLIAFDSKDNVVGCLAPWAQGRVQEYIPLRYSGLAHNFRQALKFFWLFGMTRRLTKPVRSTGVEAPLKFRHLTNIFVDNEDIFESLLWNAWERTEKDEFLLYAQVEQDYRLNPPLSWVSATSRFSLYSLVPPEQDIPDFLKPNISLNPDIEPYWAI